MTEPRPLASSNEAVVCARMMACSEPWLTLGRTYEQALATLTDPLRSTFVLHEGDQIAGFVIVVLQGAFVGYIQTVCVAPGARGRGAGSRLITYAEQIIFQRSPNVFMCVSSFNHDAQRLYERLGYQRVGVLEDYVVSGHAEILLRKTRGPLSGFIPA